MNRKNFLQHTGLLIAGAGVSNSVMAATNSSAHSWIIPPYLQKGDTIGITSPAGYILEKDIQSAVQKIQSWGFKVEIGKTIGTRDGSLGGTDAARLTDFQNMLNSRHIKAILCARGGYGLVRIIDQMDFSKLRAHPKWIIGFSDITVLHCHINNNHRIATIHSKMCNSFPDDWAKADPVQVQTIESIQKVLTGTKMSYNAPYNAFNRTGKASGILVGGNLRTMENLAATDSDIDTHGKILFVEDTGEYLYNIDRMFWSFKRTGKLKHLGGLIVGGFNTKAETNPDDEFTKSLFEIVMEKVKPYNYPVCFDFPVGHQKNNFALKCGVRHRLTVASEGSSLIEN
ncbi:LD-carboxypeptidase [Danxiaibacter flavus]|uniref:LD-carboxypeptidase n=1 Tax=Danxiaibacter flavus TaxID=3049108 RepID=A0ABV3Z9X7_9BACT|nr:LD-carboxypeptidase [Chitinophagaceae bacterium DXS]